MSRLRILVVAGLLASVVASRGVPPASALQSGGNSVSDGQRTLSVSQVTDLDPAGHVVQVTGSGYDTFKGIYVAFCVVPPANQVPSPCGGGMDMSGTSGASHWISSNPPPYGVAVAVPYGPGGSFSVALAIAPTIGAVDCRTVQCAVVTRNDHQRSTDRSQDVFVPVSFAALPQAAPAPVAPEGGAGDALVTAPPSELTTTTPPVETPPPPEAPVETDAVVTTTSAPDEEVTDDAAVAATQPESGGSSWLPIVAGVALAVVAIAVLGVGLQRRRSAP
jgi:hypothetical protein